MERSKANKSDYQTRKTTYQENSQAKRRLQTRGLDLTSSNKVSEEHKLAAYAPSWLEYFEIVGMRERKGKKKIDSEYKIKE